MITEKDHATTPKDIVDKVKQLGPIVLDPCWNPFACTEPEIRLDGSCPEEDGLLCSWRLLLDLHGKDGIAYCNPPYSRGNLLPWAQKIVKESRAGVDVVALVPGDPTTQWFRYLAKNASCGIFLPFRVKFGGYGAQGDKRPSTLWCFGSDSLVEKFLEVFGKNAIRIYCGGANAH